MEGPSEASKSQPQEQKPAQGKIEEREENPIDKIREQLLSMQFEPKHIQQALSKTQNLDKAIQIIISLLEDGDTQQKYKIDEAELVILVRMDLKMGLGKIAAQNAHATLKAFLQCRQRAQSDDGYSFTFIEWLQNGQKKSIYQVESEPQLFELLEKAKSKGISICHIRDAGRTQIAAGSVTVGALGPCRKSDLSPLVTNLRFL